MQVSNRRPGEHTSPGPALAVGGAIIAASSAAAVLGAELGASIAPVPLAAVIPGAAGLVALGYLVGRLASGPPAITAATRPPATAVYSVTTEAPARRVPGPPTRQIGPGTVPGKVTADSPASGPAAPR